jgi:hypothetical protein
MGGQRIPLPADCTGEELRALSRWLLMALSIARSTPNEPPLATIGSM